MRRQFVLDNRPAVNVHLDLSFRFAKTCQSRDHYRLAEFLFSPRWTHKSWRPAGNLFLYFFSSISISKSKLLYLKWPNLPNLLLPPPSRLTRRTKKVRRMRSLLLPPLLPRLRRLVFSLWCEDIHLILTEFTEGCKGEEGEEIQEG